VSPNLLEILLSVVVDQLSATYWYSSSDKGLTDEELDRLRQQIDYVQVPVSVEVGRTELATSELLELEEGDVIKLDTDMDDPFKLCINGHPKYDCRPGLRGRTISVQVLEPIEEEEFIASLMAEIDELETDIEMESEAMEHG
jgi:flagellar motor switch protein FliM